MWRYLISIIKSSLFLFFVFTGAVVGAVYFYSDSLIRQPYLPFCVKKIEFDGNERIKDILLLKVSKIRYRSNIFSFSIYEVKKRLEDIAWVKSAIVRRKLPDTIYIRVAERIPIAILQSKYKLYLIDADGEILENDSFSAFGNLLIVTGEGAEKSASRLLNCLDTFPKIRRQLAFAVRIGKRRWNLKINRGITVKLPENGVSYALSILEEISDGNGFFNEDISIIDLRMPDRVIVTKRKQLDNDGSQQHRYSS
ncbi:MAG: FtsQ-type POTRA domain-containing protein [Holosporaceae bacterium]|nr:FtsQ-type POTRA domain-containing protein [Holosporaceae bacterium]